MTLVIASFVAGFLTVLAPCILPLLPVLLAGSAGTGHPRRIWVIIAGLTISVIVFSLLLKSLTVLLGVPQVVWQIVSGTLLIGFGAVMVLPDVWERVSLAISRRANQSLAGVRGETGVWGDFLLGAALGPVFNSCSPTYALIVAVLLPASFISGLGYLTAYALGLAVALLLIALLGRAIVVKLGWAANPSGGFRRLVGALLLIAGLAVIFGWDKQFQTYLLDRGYYNSINGIEEQLRN